MEPSVGVLVWSVDVGAAVVAAVPVAPPSVGLPAGMLVWSVDAVAVVDGAASVEPSGWQAVRVVDSISAVRAAPAFRAAGGVGLIRGWLSLCGVSGRHLVVIGLHRPQWPGMDESGLRVVLGLLPGSRRPVNPARALLPRCPDSYNANGGVVLVSSTPWTDRGDLSEETDHEHSPPPEG